MVDGVHFAGSCCIVALGIDLQGTKVPLALVEGSTENATLVTELLVGLPERGLDVTRPILAVLDGSKAQRRAVRDVFDTPVLARYSSTRSATLGTSCPRSCVLESNGGCAPGNPTTTSYRDPRPWPRTAALPGQDRRPGIAGGGDVELFEAVEHALIPQRSGVPRLDQHPA